MFSDRTEAERRGTTETLGTSGRARVRGFLSGDAAATLARSLEGAGEWRRVADAERELDVRTLDAARADQLAEALSGLGVGTVEGPVLTLRHGGGGHGLPGGGGPVSFLLDLNAGWRSPYGGLLLFVDDDGRAEGWRPEPGALTVFTAAATLTMVAHAAPAPRLAVFGRLAPPRR